MPPPAPGWGTALFWMQPRAQLPGMTAAPGVTASPSHLGQVKIRGLTLDSYIWVPAAGRKASGQIQSKHHRACNCFKCQLHCQRGPQGDLITKPMASQPRMKEAF